MSCTCPPPGSFIHAAMCPTLGLAEVHIDPECPHDEGPHHFWTCDGPFTVTCDNCGADGRITMTGGRVSDE